MIKLSDYRTQDALPGEMKTPERIALSHAFDRQKKKYISRIRRTCIWADLESVDDNKLDFLAVENRVIFYNPQLAPDVKRQLIRNSIYWYMKLGTRQTMEEIVRTVFGSENTVVEEWYAYAGEPFHFRITAETVLTQASIKDLILYLNMVKNVRSHLDAIRVNRNHQNRAYVATCIKTCKRSVAIIETVRFERQNKDILYVSGQMKECRKPEAIREE